MARQINLVNPDLRKTRDSISALPVAVVAAVLLLLVVLGTTWMRISAASAHREAEEWVGNRKQAQEALMSTTQAMAARKPDAKLLAELDTAQTLLRRQREILAVLDGKSIGDSSGFSAYLQGFARQVPQGLWLTGFIIGAGGRDLELRGRMVSPSLLPEYVKRLNAESAFRGHTFTGLQIQTPTVATTPAMAGSPPPAHTEFVLTSVAPEERR